MTPCNVKTKEEPNKCRKCNFHHGDSTFSVDFGMCWECARRHEGALKLLKLTKEELCEHIVFLQEQINSANNSLNYWRHHEFAETKGKAHTAYEQIKHDLPPTMRRD